MTIRSLTPTLVLRALPHKKTYIIRDCKLKGFHLRITPKGQWSFVLQATCKGIRFYESIGNAR